MTEELFPPSVLVSYEKVRASGLCNMFDGGCVVLEMVNNGDYRDAILLLRSDLDVPKLDTKKYIELLKQVNELHTTTSILEKS